MEFSLLLSFLFHLKQWPQVWFALLCFLSIIWFFKRKNQFSLNWPVLGRLPSILRSTHCVNEAITEAFHKFGGSFKIKGPKFTGMNYLITCHPKNLEYILKTNFSNYPKGQAFAEMLDVFADGIFTTDSDPWLIQRKMLHSRFSSREFRSYATEVSQSEVKSALLPLLVQFSKDGLVLDFQDVFLRLTFDASFTMVFGRNPKQLCAGFPSNEFTEAIDIATETIFYRHLVPTTWWKLLNLLRVGKERKYSKSWKTIDHSIEEMISSRKEEIGKGIGTNDLLSILIKSQVRGDHISDKFIRDNTLLFLFAARDTTGSGLTWFFWLISQAPHVEAKIFEELKHEVSMKSTKCVNGARVFEPEEVRDLVYLHASLCESLRLYPPAYSTHKSVLKAEKLPDGTRVKPGLKIILSMYGMARMKWIWGEDCMQFKPERWINEDGKIRNELMSKFFIFNAGPRTCLGKEMSLNLMKLVSASIIFNFHVQVVEGKPESLKPSIVLLMKEGLKVKIRDRFT